MKAITDDKLPKFLRVTNETVVKPWNRFFLKPFEKGEIVKVAPIEEQVPSDESIEGDVEMFRKHYVVVYRKDNEGKWTLKYTQNWNTMELLTTKK